MWPVLLIIVSQGGSIWTSWHVASAGHHSESGGLNIGGHGHVASTAQILALGMCCLKDLDMDLGIGL